ncbi:hypothetical protein CERSUDRAFT_75523 [Gelatoporia subvermispora B]|uniref:DUF6533 domain-containing protein n=1 Tax=Ceriporiopsis subvermispora (strain B) TaxID=914234 RepID=M2QC37_CERS8|nr:hypothetical protein CERSUDRAFT_75523 [Gelatoporia subvermispora B]
MSTLETFFTDNAQSMCWTASICLVFYDLLTTLSNEVEYIWRRRFSSVTLLFLLNRHALLVLALLQVYSDFGFGMTSALAPSTDITLSMSCSVALNLTSALQMLLIVIQSAFIAFRIYALSGGRWLISITILVFGVTGVFSYMYLTPGPQPVLNLPGIPFRQCASSDYIWTSNKYKSPILTWGIYSRSAISALADVSVIAITCRKARRRARAAGRAYSDSALSALLLKYVSDSARPIPGVLHFGVLLFLDIIALGAYIKYSKGSSWVLSTIMNFQTPLQAITMSHFLLSLREAAHTDLVRDLGTQQSVLGSQQTSMGFVSFAGPMGESLDVGLYEGLDEGLDEDVSDAGAQS